MIGTQTLAQDHSRGRSAPLSSHPHFTLALTLWCAAMLGLPVVAISGASLESWVMAARLDTLLPTAAPPLGTTARMLLMAGFGLVGAAIGALVARALRPAPVREGDEINLRQRDRHPDAPARRPISAHAELGDEGLSGMTARHDMFPDDLSPYRSLPEEAPYRARPEAAPYQAPAFTSPFMAGAEPAAPVFAAPAAPVATPVAATPVAAQPLAAQPFAAMPAPQAAMSDSDAYDLPDIDFAGLGAPQHAPYPSPMEQAAPAAPAIPAMPAEPTEDDWHALPPVVSETDLHRLPVRAVPPLSAPVSAPVVPITLRAVESRPVERPLEQAAPAETPALIGATPVQPRASASERISHTALGDLSHVELIERLALAIHTREKGAKPVAVNDAQDADGAAASRDDIDERSGTQAILRSALAGLREVK